jgi:murein DD-endopeptidase MepM/ murein hydrolase activator NlpD
MCKSILKKLLIVTVLIVAFPFPNFFSLSFVRAQTAEELQLKIDQRNQDIASLEKEIKSYQKQITTLGTQATTLASTIKSLDLTQKKLAADIAVSENKIAAKNLEIQQLAIQIGRKASNISDDQRIITQTYNTLYKAGDQSLVETFLSSHSISGALNNLDELGSLQAGVYDRIKSLNADKQILETNKNKSEKAQADLVALNKQIKDQRAVVLSTAAQQQQLLKETNQSEANFRRVLADKQALQAAFQQELNNYESQLHLLVNPALLPHTGSGVLTWPLDAIQITQYFGNTPFATANPQLYSGKGHTGVDFRASIGTPVKAALDGIVIGVGNTDVVPTCYSYGKWIMVKHPNGLSTLYAHLSVQSVTTGQQVGTGQVIGYSGNTGYTTGPHLHFGVYATQGVQIKKFDTSVNCKGVLIPLADFSAYLNPLSYL